MLVRTFALLALSATLMGCGGDDATEGSAATGTEQSGGEGTPPSGEGPGASVERTPEQACIAMMTRERECQEQFIPALVGLRVRLDQPPGTAARDGSEGRDALVAQARTEYTRDATDEAFQRNCAQLASMPAERVSAWTATMQSCLAASECGAFVECDMRFTEARFSAQ